MDKFARNLQIFQNKAAREVSSRSLNRIAKAAKLLGQKNLRKELVLRNKFSEKSVRSTRTPATRPIDRQFTLAGSVQPYLALQQFGGARPRKGKGSHLTTARGSREGETAYPRGKLAKGKLKIKNIRIAPKPRIKQRLRSRVAQAFGRGGSRGREAHIAIELARRKGFRFVYLELGRDRSGIFQILKKSIRMVHWITSKRIRVKPTFWFSRAADTARKAAPGVFLQELKKTERLFKS